VLPEICAFKKATRDRWSETSFLGQDIPSHHSVFKCSQITLVARCFLRPCAGDFYSFSQSVYSRVAWKSSVDKRISQVPFCGVDGVAGRLSEMFSQDSSSGFVCAQMPV